MRVPFICGSMGALAVVGLGLSRALAGASQTPATQRSLLFELPALLLTLAAGFGLYLVGSAWPYREGERLHCTRCGHPWSPEDSRLHTYCQECGAPWRWFGGRVPGRPVRRPAMLSIGILLCVLAIPVVILWTTAPSRLAAGAPAWLLTRKVELAPWYRSRVEWNELMGRRLASGDEQALAAAILQKRLRERSIPAPMAAWFERELTGSRLPGPLADRWVLEMMDITLSAPVTARVGEIVPVIARGQYRGGCLSVVNPAQIVVAGLSVGDEKRVRARETRGAPAALFASGRTLLDQTISPEKEGPLTVRLRVYFVGAPPLGTVAYGADGVPIFPKAVYTRCIELERTIMVDPAPEPK